MNTKKLLITALAVFIVVEVTNYLIHGVILGSTYASDEVKNAFRQMEDMESKMWVMWVVDLIWSFFFAFFFAKGYENKGIMEGVRFGIYVGLFVSLVASYAQYVVYPLPYSVTFQWFLYGLIQSVLLGVIAALIYKPMPKIAES